MSVEWMDDYSKWQRWAYDQRFGRGSWGKDHGIEPDSKVPAGFVEYDSEVKEHWDSDSAVGIMEKEGKFIGIACLVAKEVVEKESFVRRFGLRFEKDIQWHAVSGLLDHLSRSPMFKAVLITTSKIPFKLEPILEKMTELAQLVKEALEFSTKVKSSQPNANATRTEYRSRGNTACAHRDKQHAH